MKIGIDIYPLSKKFQGISVYLYNLLKHLYHLDNENHYYLYTFPFSSLRLPFKVNASWQLRFKKGCLDKSATAWMQLNAKRDLQKDNIDIFWGPEGILPLNLAPKIKTIVTVHDLTFYFYPSALKWNNRFIFPLFFKKSILKATTIVTVSCAVASEIKKIFPEISHKVISIHSGIEHQGGVATDQNEAKEYVSEKFKTSQNYILTVSTLEPRKNIENLLRAYALFKKNNRQAHRQLLIAGAPGWKTSPLYALYVQLGLGEEDVKFLGFVPHDDMPQLYRGAEVFLFPSLYEGFGFPPLEALTYQTPVIVSDIPVFRETMEESVFFINPRNPEDIARALYQVLTDNSLKEQLVQKGSERIKSFSWEKTAREMLALLKS